MTMSRASRGPPAGRGVDWSTWAAEDCGTFFDEVDLHIPPARPFCFYGPGPDAKDATPVGTLHYARYKYESADVEYRGDDADNYDDEVNPVYKDGRRLRPEYHTEPGGPVKEVNYFRWERVTLAKIDSSQIYPLTADATESEHEDYLLNDGDFNNDEDYRSPDRRMVLANRENEDAKAIYPLGYKLLKKFSRVYGFPEWQEGDALGSDPANPNALTKHLGWLPRKRRINRAGLGADPHDAIWKDFFRGKLDAKPTSPFVEPKPTWRNNPKKVTIFRSPSNPLETFRVVSRDALINSLPPPSPESIGARKAFVSDRVQDKPSQRRNIALRAGTVSSRRCHPVAKPNIAPTTRKASADLLVMGDSFATTAGPLMAHKAVSSPAGAPVSTEYPVVSRTRTASADLFKHDNHFTTVALPRNTHAVITKGSPNTPVEADAPKIVDTPSTSTTSSYASMAKKAVAGAKKDKSRIESITGAIGNLKIGENPQATGGKVLAEDKSKAFEVWPEHGFNDPATAIYW